MTPASRLEDLFTAARMYYGQSQTMEAIAGELGVSRSTVSRMLRDAREAGLVQITLRPPAHNRRRGSARRTAGAARSPRRCAACPPSHVATPSASSPPTPDTRGRLIQEVA